MKNIIHIAFGEDISAEKIQMLQPVDKTKKKPMVEKEMIFGESITHTFRVLGETISLKASNIFYRATYAVTGKSVEFTQFEKDVEQNCIRLRAFIRKYVRARKSGERKS